MKSFLLSHGISTERMEAVGIGAVSPLADNATPKGRAYDRRVEIIMQHPSDPAGASPK